MACFHPVAGYRDANGEFTSDPRKGSEGSLTVPCGRCVGCRRARARMWSLRCVHEASLHEANCFVTLTYADASLPEGGTLRYRDFQLFMKRMRKHYGARPIRYFVCGEYGENFHRPHYHACLFGVDFFEDRSPVNYLGTSKRHKHYTSPLLSRLWSHGDVDITDLNSRTAEYAASYILKKVTGDRASSHYSVTDGDGVVHHLEPEFARMSVRPGLGAEWFSRFGSDVASGDSIVHNGKENPVPAYYDKLRKRGDPLGIDETKAERQLRSYMLRSNSTPERLAVREEIALAKGATLKRRYEQ